MAQLQLKTCNKNAKNPTRFSPTTMSSYKFGCANSWICNNAACRTIIPLDVYFCLKCSCCICHKFDENKDPSLWLVCASDSELLDSCGISCHIECALRYGKVGVLNIGQYMRLDGSYCCGACGKVSGILGCWRKQLVIAKEARRINVLCSRIFLSYRLLHGTSRLKELFDIVAEAKTKLEAELGPMTAESVKMARGLVSRLAIGDAVQKLCSQAIDKAGVLLANASHGVPKCKVDSLPAACRFLFEEITPSSIVLFLVELPMPFDVQIKGYKLWYCKSFEETFRKEPAYVFPREEKRIFVKYLRPCTKYTFKIISFTQSGELGHSEAQCFTKSIELFKKKRFQENPGFVHESSPNVNVHQLNSCEPQEQVSRERAVGVKAEESPIDQQSPPVSLELGLNVISVPEQQVAPVELGLNVISVPEQQLPPVSLELGLNVFSVPDSNGDLTPPLELGLNVISIPDSNEDLTPSLELGLNVISTPDSNQVQAPHVESSEDEDDLTSVLESSEDEDDLTSAPESSEDEDDLTSASESSEDEEERLTPEEERTLSANVETRQRDSTLAIQTPVRSFCGGRGTLNGTFEYCVEVIRWLEIGGYITQEFRMLFLTWLSRMSTEQDRRVVNSFILNLITDPRGLAEQLVDSFGEIVLTRRPRTGFP